MLKLVALLCIASVILALVLAHQSPAVGYELSIYTSTPFPVLWLLFLSLVGGIGIVIHELFTRRFEDRRTYLVGFAVTLLAVTAFLCLPSIRDYVTSTRGDQLGHLGYLLDILRTGHLGDNPYPITHALLAQITSVTGLSVLEITNLNTVFIFVIFILTTYLLATVVLPHEGQRLLAALVAGGTMAGISRYYLVPNTWSILMLPLLFYCYFKQDRMPFKILLATILVAYPFFHPLSSLMIIAALAVMELPKPIYKRLLRRLSMGVPSWIESRPIVWPTLLESAVFAPWVFTRDAYRSNVSSFLTQLANFSGSKEISKTGESLGKAGVHGLDILILMVKMYGEILIFVIVAFVGIILLVRQLRAGDRDSSKYRLLLLGVLALSACLVYAAFFVGIPGAKAIAADRFLVYIEVASIPLVAFALWDISRRTEFSRLAKALIFGLVVLALLLNLIGHYGSPYRVRPNEQATQRDMAGMTWYLDEKDPLVLAFYVQTPPERFSQGILGNEATDLRRDMPYFSQVETHFGYDNFTTLREQHDGDRYVNINRYDRVVYQTVWQSLGRFNDADFEKLEQDPTVDRIYSNGEMDVLFVSRQPRT
jgi:hypothetical protein